MGTNGFAFNKNKFMKMEDTTYRFYDITGKLFTVISMLIGLLAIYWLILKLTNHSPSLDQIIIGMVMTMFIWVAKISNDVSKNISETRHIEKRTALEFKYANKKLDTLCMDFKDFKRDMSKEISNLSIGLNELKSDLRTYAAKNR